MKDKHFNCYEFSKINDIVVSNPYEALKRYEKYLEIYPKDLSARNALTALLISLGKIDEAKKMMLETKEIFQSIKDRIERHDIYKWDMLKNRIMLLCYEEKYKEAGNIFFDHKSFLENTYGIDVLAFYYKWSTRNVTEEERNKRAYLHRQMMKYKEEEFLEHIKKHFPGYIPKDGVPIKGVFNSNFEFEKAYSEIKKNIPSDNKLFHSFLFDTYIFKYDYCGRSNNNITDFFKIIAIHNTDNIITMYPSCDCELLPFVDLNYIDNEEEAPVRRKSRIDKFNEKYNK